MIKLTMKKVLVVLFGSVFIYSLVSLAKIINTLAPDFSVYYASAHSLLTHQSLYTIHSFTVFNYPPISSLFFVPFVLLPYQLAQGIFVSLSYLCIFACIVLCFKILNKKIAWQIFLIISALFLLSFPTKFTLGMGQSNLIAYTLFLLSVFLENKSKKIFSGIILAIAIILKPIFVLLILYFLFKKSWNSMFTTIITGLILLVFQQLFFAQTFSQWTTYITHILPGLMTTKGREVYYNQGLLGTISRFTTNLEARQIFNWIGVIIILADGIKNILQTKNNQLTLSVLLCTLPLIDSLSWQHHFVILLFPFLFTYYQLKNSKQGVSLLAISYLLISANIKNPNNYMWFPVSIALSHVFWGTLLLLMLLLYSAKILQRGK